jgi:hypothetical protein
MTLTESQEQLRRLSSSVSDEGLRFSLSQLVLASEHAVRHRASGNYFNAKEIALFTSQQAHALESDPRIDGDARAAVKTIKCFADDVMSLPDGARPAPGPYSERYPVGSAVRIASLQQLQEFIRTWKFHHALIPEQLKYAGMVTVVQAVGYYHGGDVVYTLRDTRDFAWLEPCLRDVDGSIDKQS